MYWNKGQEFNLSTERTYLGDDIYFVPDEMADENLENYRNEVVDSFVFVSTPFKIVCLQANSSEKITILLNSTEHATLLD